MKKQNEIIEEVAVAEKRYLTFEMDEVYAIEMQVVKEVIRYKSVTPVPQVPEYVAGVMNVRGTIFAVIDMRKRLKKSDREDFERCCIIIIEAEDDQIGLLVDDIADIAYIPVDRLTLPPQIPNSYAQNFIKELGVLETGVIQILDTDRVISLGDVEAVDLAVQEAEL